MSGIAVFSDGGPAHFKNSTTINFFSEFARQHNITIMYNFFASSHGKSVVDTIASIVKKALAALAHLPDPDYFTQPIQVHHSPFTPRTNTIYRLSTPSTPSPMHTCKSLMWIRPTHSMHRPSMAYKTSICLCTTQLAASMGGSMQHTHATATQIQLGMWFSLAQASPALFQWISTPRNLETTIPNNKTHEKHQNPRFLFIT